MLSFLGLTLRSGNIIFGYSCVRDELAKKKSKRRLKMILLARDLSQRSGKNVLNMLHSFEASDITLCDMNHTMDEIYSATGKYSGILGITHENMALRIYQFVQADPPLDAVEEGVLQAKISK